MTAKLTAYLKTDQPLILGVDIGTSGIRAALVSVTERLMMAEFSVDMPLPERQGDNSQQCPSIWIATLNHLFSIIQKAGYSSYIEHIIFDATSSTVCLVDAQGNALTKALMYDDRRAQPQAQKIKHLANTNTAAHGASSTLAKVMWLIENTPRQQPIFICHQIDFIVQHLTGIAQVTDVNNALKLGFDPVTHSWPSWIAKCLPNTPLPKVVSPGDYIGQILPGLVKIHGFSSSIKLYAGTTDSIAAFLASGASKLGDAVTSLGSTLALKLFTDRPIFAPEYGIYSHRLDKKWLVGGASNTGGAVLLQHFSLAELLDLLPQLNPEQPTGLQYYPLLSPGERFPIADAKMAAKLTPEASNTAEFLLGLMEGLVEIERLGYQRLSELGAYPIKRIFTAGGGVKNSIWMRLREKNLTVAPMQSLHHEAAFGVTQLIKVL